METAKKMDINNMLALINIFYDYEKFMANFTKFMSGKNNYHLVERLRKYVYGEFDFPSVTVKKFYDENFDIISKIEEYSNISFFINMSYDFGEKTRKDYDLNYFYKYLAANEDKLEDIKKLLLKLRTLGISDFEFDPTFDFTKEEYDICENFVSNCNINYLDNIKIIPDYRDSVIKYKSEGSNYLIKCKPFFGNDFFGTEIILNSLTFDSTRIPSVINKKEIFDTIVSLGENTKDVSKEIRNSVELGVGIIDFENQFRKLANITNKLENIKDKNELKNVLANIKKEIGKLKEIDEAQNNEVIKNNENITKELIEQGKKKYLSIREFQQLDLC